MRLILVYTYFTKGEENSYLRIDAVSVAGEVRINDSVHRNF